MLTNHLICAVDRLPSNIAMSDFVRHVDKDVARWCNKHQQLMTQCYGGKQNQDGSDPMQDEANFSPNPRDLWDMCQSWKRELDHMMLTMVEKVRYQPEAPLSVTTL